MTKDRNRAAWTDARFFIGIALVAASIVGVWWVMTSARTTVAVAVAGEQILPGEAVTDQNITWVDVALGDAGSAYLSTVPDDVVATRELSKGELVPASALIGSDRSAVTTVVITSTSDVASTVEPGSQVDVWMSPLKDRVFGEARILISQATVAAIRESKGFASSGAVTLEIIVLSSDVQAILDAQSSQAAMWAVPSGGVR